MAVVNRFDVYLVNLDSSPSDDAENTVPEWSSRPMKRTLIWTT